MASKRTPLLLTGSCWLSAACVTVEPASTPVVVKPPAVSISEPQVVMVSSSSKAELEAVVRDYLDGDEPAELAAVEPDRASGTLELDPNLVVGARHILISYANATRAPSTVSRDRSAARRLAEQVLTRVQRGMSFQSAASQFSDEPDASRRGGDLGTFKLGVMVPEFSNSVGRMSVGELRLVESPFGFHVVERTQ